MISHKRYKRVRDCADRSVGKYAEIRSPRWPWTAVRAGPPSTGPGKVWPRSAGRGLFAREWRNKVENL